MWFILEQLSCMILESMTSCNCGAACVHLCPDGVRAAVCWLTCSQQPSPFPPANTSINNLINMLWLCSRLKETTLWTKVTYMVFSIQETIYILNSVLVIFQNRCWLVRKLNCADLWSVQKLASQAAINLYYNDSFTNSHKDTRQWVNDLKQATTKVIKQQTNNTKILF